MIKINKTAKLHADVYAFSFFLLQVLGVCGEKYMEFHYIAMRVRSCYNNQRY